MAARIRLESSGERCHDVEGLPDRCNPEPLDGEEALGAASSHWRGIPEPGRDQTLGFETFERDEHGGSRHSPVALFLDGVPNRYGIGLVVQAEHSQEDDQFEISKVWDDLAGAPSFK